MVKETKQYRTVYDKDIFDFIGREGAKNGKGFSLTVNEIVRMYKEQQAKAK